jgi:multiple sugar transport system substrate-binding protein
MNRGTSRPMSGRQARIGLALGLLAALILTSACGMVVRREPPDPAAEQVRLSEDAIDPLTIELARFFGDCEDSTLGVTDVSQATSECEVIQILTNEYNADSTSGVTVERLGGAQFAAYYDTLNATYAGGSPPDVAVMHAANLPDYAGRDLLVPLDDVLAEAGVDPSLWTEPARQAVTFEGKIYGVPFDVHTNLWHVNRDLFAEAGLVDGDGEPVLPTNPEEFFEQAEQLQERTGAQYFAIDANQFALSVMMFLTLLYQQGGTITDEAGTTATLDSPEALEALRFMNQVFDRGYARATQDYTAAQTAFLNGDAAVFQNGTWVVNQYAAEADFDYGVTPFPTLYDQPAAWANSHIWVLPVQDTSERYAEALDFVSFLSENDAAWAIGTGHLPAVETVLSSAEFEEAPQRANFAEGAVDQARLLPQVGSWQPIEDVLKTQVESTWLTGVSPEVALDRAQRLIGQRLATTGLPASDGTGDADRLPSGG